MAFDEHLADRVRKFLRSRKMRSAEKRMMGGLCFMVNDKMCVGVEKERLMLRIGPEAYGEALTRKGCRPMDFTGRPMKGFVFVDAEAVSTARALGSWLGLALAYNPLAKASSKRKAGAENKSRKVS